MDISTRFIGLEDCTKQLRQLESIAKEKALTYRAMFYATTPFVQEVKRLAPIAEGQYYRYYKGQKGNGSRVLQTPGKLKKSIKRKRVKLPSSIGVGVYSAPIKNGAAKKFSVFYWRFLEYGTPKMRAFPFFRPAFDHKKDEALERFKQRYREYVQDVVQRRTIGGQSASE